MALVDVIIATRGRGTLIDITIASIRESHYTEYDLWVVDQSPDDATERVVAQHAAVDARVHYVRSTSQGVDIARNEGVAMGCAPFLLFTDDDCRVAADWLGTMLHELEQEGIWAVFGRVVPDEAYSPQPVVTPDCPSDSVALRALPMACKDNPQRRVYQGNRFDLGFGHGASMGLRRSCWQELGGFDELLGAGAPLHSWPERDLGYRILRRGGRIVYTPAALVYHRHWRGWPEVRRTYRNYALGAGGAIGKYLRCGDLAALYLLGEWFVSQGLRQIISGVLRWHSVKKMQVGLLQLVYPWVGLAQGRRYAVDRERLLYRWS